MNKIAEENKEKDKEKESKKLREKAIKRKQNEIIGETVRKSRRKRMIKTPYDPTF